MFPHARHVVSLRGIAVRVTPSWLVVVVLATWLLADRFWVAGRAPVVALAMAAIGVAGLMASVLLHEFGHASTARARDLHVHGITMFLFGGLTEMDPRTTRPRDEFAIAAIGPWTSLVLGSALGLVTATIDWYWPRFGAISDVTGMLAWMNVALALTNMVPGAPLDGGRVLRAGLWAVTGDRHRAAVIAAWVGQVLGMATVVLGGVVAVRGAAVAEVLGLAVVGSFLAQAAGRERQQSRLFRVMAEHEAGLFGDLGPTIDEQATLATVHARMRSLPRPRTLVAVDHAGLPTGVITARDVNSVDAFDREHRRAVDVATPLQALPHVSTTDPLVDVVSALHGAPAAVVTTPDGLVHGIADAVAADDLLRGLATGR